MGLWPTKKDPSGPPDLPAEPARNETVQFEQLTGQLERLRELFQQANQQIAAYLIRREAQAAPGMLGPSVALDADGLYERLAAIEDKLDRLAAASSAPAGGGEPGAAHEQSLRALLQPIHQVLDAVNRRSAALVESFRHVQEKMDHSLERLADMMIPPQPQAEETPTVAFSHDWERAILGDALASDPMLTFQRQQLVAGILDGDAGACALAGQLLIFQSSAPERLPQLLKDIGEAYYRWQPKISHGVSPMEEALVAWLQKKCEAAKINNVIEVVHPGERFDSTRHVTTGRGVEITEVLGWIVLRDNGKVYTKANVAVK